jgi:hypothetical protein
MDRVDRLNGWQKIVLGCAAALVSRVLMMNIFLIGGVDIVQELDALIPLPLALLISLFLLRLWWNSERNEVGRKIWGTFLIGMVLWFVAEGVWNVYSLLGLELPFPSLADIPWFIGYFFFFWALYLRFRSLRVSLRRNEVLLLVLLYTPLVILTLALSIIPVLLEKDPFFVAALSIFYPLADLIIPFRSINVMMALRKGALNRPWGLISAGFLCLSISDLAFSFADRNNMYWPGGAPNFISISGDWLYIVAYVLMGLGVYFVPMLLGRSDLQEVEEGRTVAPLAQPAPVMQNAAFLSTDASGKIFYISTGAIELFGLQGSGDCLNSSISKFLMKSEDEIEDTLHKIARRGTLEKQDRVTLSQDPARTIPLKVLAVASRDIDGKFVGADFFFYPVEALNLPVRNESYVRELIQEKKQPDVQEPNAGLFWYFRAQVKVIYVLIARYAGLDVANQVVSQFNASAVKNEWAIKMDPVSLDVTDWQSGTQEQRAYVYRSLLKQAADYAIAIASYSTAVRELQFLDSSIPAELKETIDFFGFRFPYNPAVPAKTIV